MGHGEKIVEEGLFFFRAVRGFGCIVALRWGRFGSFERLGLRGASRRVGVGLHVAFIVNRSLSIERLPFSFEPGAWVVCVLGLRKRSFA